MKEKEILIVRIETLGHPSLFHIEIPLGNITHIWLGTGEKFGTEKLLYNKEKKVE